MNKSSQIYSINGPKRSKNWQTKTSVPCALIATSLLYLGLESVDPLSHFKLPIGDTKEFSTGILSVEMCRSQHSENIKIEHKSIWCGVFMLHFGKWTILLEKTLCKNALGLSWYGKSIKTTEGEMYLTWPIWIQGTSVQQNQSFESIQSDFCSAPANFLRYFRG